MKPMKSMEPMHGKESVMEPRVEPEQPMTTPAPASHVLDWI